MTRLESSKLQHIGSGANGKVFRVPKELSGLPFSAVVKTCKSSSAAKRNIDNYDALRHCGVMHFAFMQECLLDGEPAILMEDLTIPQMVYVSPNSVYQGHTDNEAEAYLLANKLTDISDFDNIIVQLRDLVHCTAGKGVEILCDTIFFGVEKGQSASRLSYKIADLDGMMIDPSAASVLYDYNAIDVKQALEWFIRYFVKDGTNKIRLLNKLKSIELR